MEKNLREGEVVAGGSTITQQLAKNLFLSGDRAWWRKAQEAVIAVMIELVMDKRRTDASAARCPRSGQTISAPSH